MSEWKEACGGGTPAEQTHERLISSPCAALAEYQTYSFAFDASTL